MATKVEIVDDHLLFADALGSVIRDLPDYELVGTAVTGPQALSIARSAQPDVVLLDYHLPGEDAERLVPRLRGVCPQAKVIILTGDASDASLARGLRAGVAGYLTKDRALDDVLSALETVSSGGTYVSDEQRARVQVAAGGGSGEALTDREIEILRLLATGKDSQSIAEELTISANTVRTHLQNIFSKLGVHSKLEAVAVANARGLIRL